MYEIVSVYPKYPTRSYKIRQDLTRSYKILQDPTSSIDPQHHCDIANANGCPWQVSNE